MGWCLAASLIVLVVAHVTLVAGIARAGSWRRAVAAFLVPPLAPWWGFRAGLRAATIAWCAALALYTALLVVA